MALVSALFVDPLGNTIQGIYGKLYTINLTADILILRKIGGVPRNQRVHVPGDLPVKLPFENVIPGLGALICQDAAPERSRLSASAWPACRGRRRHAGSACEGRPDAAPRPRWSRRPGQPR